MRMDALMGPPGPRPLVPAKLAAFTLESQLALQLGCVGSRSKITHGTHAPVRISNVTRDMYFDVANINQYDCILGLPFLRNN